MTFIRNKIIVILTRLVDKWGIPYKFIYLTITRHIIKVVSFNIDHPPQEIFKWDHDTHFSDKETNSEVPVAR